MKKLLGLFLLALAAMTVVSCEREDRKGVDSQEPLAIMNVDGKTIEYCYAADQCSVMDEEKGLYYHILMISDNKSMYKDKVAAADDTASSSNNFTLYYVSESPKLEPGVMYPAYSDDGKIASLQPDGKQLFFSMQASGMMYTDSSSKALYMYWMDTLSNPSASSQPSITVTENDGVYTIHFENMVMKSMDSTGEFNASFIMNGKVVHSEVPGTGTENIVSINY